MKCIFLFLLITGEGHSQERQNLSLLKADSLFNLVRKEFRTDIAKAEIHALEAYRIYLNENEINKTIKACSALSSIYYNSSKIVKAKEFAAIALRLTENNSDVSLKNYVRSTNNYAALQKEIGNYAAAITKLENLLKKESIDSVALVKIHTNLSINYNLIFDYENSEYHYDRATRVRPQSSKISYSFRLQHPKAIRLFKTGKILEAIDFLKGLLDKQNNSDLETQSEVTALRWLAKAYNENHNYTKALESIKASYLLSPKNDNYEKSRSQIVWGDIYTKQEKFLEGLTQYKQAFETMVLDSLQSNPKVESLVLNRIATSYSHLGESTEALSFINKSLNALTINLDDSLEPLVVDKVLFRENLYLKAMYLKALQASPDEIVQVFDQAIEMIMLSRNDINSIASKVSDGVNSALIFEEAISYIVSLDQAESSEENYWKALYWSDLSKSMTLSEVRNQHQLMWEYSKDSIYSNYVNQYSELQALFLQASEKRRKNAKDSSYYQVVEEIISKQASIKELTQRNDLGTLSLSQFREKLSALSFIEIFSGLECYYFFIKGKHKLQYRKLNKGYVDSIMIAVRQYLAEPKTKFNSNLDRDKYLAAINEMAQWFSPKEISLDEKTLYVVADGSFFNFPFGLLSWQGKAQRRVQLINSIPIAYSYSLKSINTDKSIFDYKQVLGVAPNFGLDVNSSIREYEDLSCNQSEIEKINTYFKVAALNAGEATISHVGDKISENDIIHFATHAYIDENNYLKNHIVLSDSKFMALDFYNYNWRNKSVVLSACSTAQGKEVDGEGIFSMARTLIELGCQEVLVSLWPVDDCVTSEIMTLLYKHLPQEKTLVNGLQRAKLDYTSSCPDHLRDPYYWSSFIVFTSMAGSVSNSMLSTAFWIFFFLTIGVLGIIAIKRWV